MDPRCTLRPVADPLAASEPIGTNASLPLDQRGRWPHQSKETAAQLHRLLVIADRDWHSLKTQADRRAAEQLAAALVHLISVEAPSSTDGMATRRSAIELTEHALSWLKGERKDPGCPSHGR